ncbi:MAG: NADH:flavin oxidoreductase [Oscillospiraceae bacterium]|nr:NADH:flavin oxidoreductase [Oscillospiraceae bacterium]
MALVTDKIRINRSVLKNRMTMAPTVKFEWAGDDGKLSRKHIDHYSERAAKGIGLLCVEATAVTPDGRFDHQHIGLWDDSQIDEHRYVTDACRDNGVISLIQLNHTGIITNPDMGPAIGPSSVETRRGLISTAMTLDQIHEMQQRFIEAAARAKKAGYDGIQLHGCHGYLINQFICRSTNHRDDEYGGSEENRARFAVEIIKKIRRECGKDFIISVRTAGADPDLESCADIAEEYVNAGCDYLQVSSGINDPDPSLDLKDPMYNMICGLGVHFHDRLGTMVPVSCVNGIHTPEQVRYLIENDLTDTVDLGRAMLADPAFPLAVLEGADYVRCFACPRCQYVFGTEHKCPAEAVRNKNK